MRIATYNVEWFTGLFSRDSKLLLDDNWSRRYNVTRRQQGEAVAAVLRRVNPDMILIVEAPNTGNGASTVTALESFAQHFHLRQNKALIGFESDTHQEIALMYDPAIVAPVHNPQGRKSAGEHGRKAPRFDGKFLYDVDLDGKADVHVFSKPPMELRVESLSNGRHFRMIGVHTKSKSTFGAKTEAEELEMLIENRRKQLAQCIWIRQRVEMLLDHGDDFVVLGDFNDGPGANGLEGLFARSGVEIVMGTPADPPERRLTEPHAAIQLDPHNSWVMATSRFYNAEYKRYLNALLDYVMLPKYFEKSSRAVWRIWHPFDDPECFKDDDLRAALLAASDHFPVTVDVQI